MMMGWFMPVMHGSGMAFMAMGSVLWLLLAVLVVTGVAVAARSDQRLTRPGTGPRGLLAERYARGEIGDEEYQRRLRTLGGGDV